MQAIELFEENLIIRYFILNAESVAGADRLSIWMDDSDWDAFV